MSRAGSVRIVALGECMVRLSVDDGRTIEDADRFDVFVGGAEANVAVALARLGHRVDLVSRVGHGPSGRRIVSHLRGHGVGTSFIVVDEARRTGTYLTEVAGEPRGISVTYDRAGSAASAMTAQDVTDAHLDGAGVAVVSGITPALGPGCAEATRRFIDLAVSVGAHTVFDVNYRSKLWDAESASTVLDDMCRSVSTVVCTSQDAELLFGVGGPSPDRAVGLAERFGSSVVMTDGANGVHLCTNADAGPVTFPAIPTDTVDRIGAGDALCAGVVDGIVDGDLVTGVRHGVALASLTRATRGDCFLGNRADVERVVSSTGSPPSVRR